jgi:hypothetical protein
MGLRVRGKATAGPNEVGDPSLRVRTWCLPGTGIPRRRKREACGVPNLSGAARAAGRRPRSPGEQLAGTAFSAGDRSIGRRLLAWWPPSAAVVAG